MTSSATSACRSVGTRTAPPGEASSAATKFRVADALHGRRMTRDAPVGSRAGRGRQYEIATTKSERESSLQTSPAGRRCRLIADAADGTDEYFPELPVS